MSTPHRLRPIPLSQALQQTSTRLSTGIQSLDDVLGGGLKTGQVTEITGPPGVGKTRFILNLSQQASSTLWISCTSLPFFPPSADLSKVTHIHTPSLAHLLVILLHSNLHTPPRFKPPNPDLTLRHQHSSPDNNPVLLLPPEGLLVIDDLTFPLTTSFPPGAPAVRKAPILLSVIQELQRIAGSGRTVVVTTAMGTRVVRGYGAVLQSALSTGTDRSGGTGGVGGVGTRVVLLRREGVVRDDYEGHMGIQGLLGVSKQGGGGREYLGGTQALLSTQGMLGTPDTQGTQGLTSSQRARRLRKVECLREFRLVKWEGREDEEGVLRWFGVLKDGAWRDVPAEETVEELLEEEGEWGGLTKEQREFGDFWPVELDAMVEGGVFLEDDGGVGGEGYVVPGKAVEGGVEEDEVEGSKEIGEFGRVVTETVEEEGVEVPKESEQREDQSKVEDAYFSDSSLTPPPETPKTAEEEQIAEEIVTTEEHQPIKETGAVEVNRSSSLTPVPEDLMEAPERSSSLTPLEETPDPAANQPLLPIEPAYEYQPEEATYPEAAPEEELPEYSEYPTQHQLKHPPQQPYELAEAAEEPPYSPRAPSVSPISTPLTTNPTPRATPPPPEDPPEIPFIASQILSGPALRDALQQARESTQRRMAASRIPPNYPLPAEADPSIAPALVEEELSTQDTLPHLSQHNLHHLNESFQSTASNTTSDHPVLSQPPPSSPRPEAPVPSPLTMMRSPQKAPGKRKWGMEVGEIPDSDGEDEEI